MKLGNSIEVSKAELDLFRTPYTQTSIEDAKYDDIQAQASYNTSNVIRFDIPGESAHYINLAETEIHIIGRISLKKDPNTGIEITNLVGPVNNFLSSLISKVNISINNKPVEMSNDAYPIRSYMENLLSYNKQEKVSSLVGDIFIKDKPSLFNILELKKTDLIPELNTGFILRREKFLKNNSVQMQGRLHCDLFNLDHLMVPLVSLQVVLTKSSPVYYLMGVDADKYIFNYEECFLRIKRQIVSPSVMAAHAEISEHSTFKYPLKRVTIRPFVIPSTSVKFLISPIITGIMPRRVICGFLKTTAFDGDALENPFNFENFGITSLILKLNSQSVPHNGLILDFSNSRYLDGYRSLAKICKELDITYDEYKNGYALFCFDLNPDISSSEHYSLLKDGSLEIEIKRAKPSDQSITLIVYTENDNILEINRIREPSFDYQI
jgi:hypothetical protein